MLNALDSVKGCLLTGSQALMGFKGKERLDGGRMSAESMVTYFKTVPDVAVVYTKEAGAVSLNPTGKYSVVVCALDGVANFLEGTDLLPYGPLIGVYEGTDPKFVDCLAAGFLNIPTGTLVYAERGKGTWVVKNFSKGSAEQPERIRTRGRSLLDDGDMCTIFADSASIGNLAGAIGSYLSKKHGSKLWLVSSRCFSAGVMAVAAGPGDLAFGLDNRFDSAKSFTGEEFAPFYLIMDEAGGAITDIHGNAIISQKIGLAGKQAWNVVAGSSLMLAMDFGAELRNLPEVQDFMKKKGIL